MSDETIEIANPHSAFTTKAELYARYRWDYAPSAIQTIVERCGLDQTTRMVDVGAGTGIFTRHFAGIAGCVIALEPNPEMRRIAARELSQSAGCGVVAASAENTALMSASIDLVSVAQAIHWFQPERAQREFRRILKPGGWLAIIRNYEEESPLQEATGKFHTPEFGVVQAVRPAGSGVPPRAYFGDGDFECLNIRFVTSRTWEAFLGSLLSASYAPDPWNPRYPAFEHAARVVFDQFARQGVLETLAISELYLGQPG